jgi:phenylalanyl-tRNA synthetase alpha chain
MQNIEQIASEAIAKIKEISDEKSLDAIRIHYLGKTGQITLKMKDIAQLPQDERKIQGSILNIAKNQISEVLEHKKNELRLAEINVKLQAETLDITQPPREKIIGRIHPLTQVTEEVIAILGSLGFSVAEGPDIEDDFHNFTALNIPESHPARQMHDTFYLEGGADAKKYLLRTHTSSIQVRTMAASKPPFRIISPDRCYRSDWDMTHTPMFHQIEGLLIDKNITMAHLKWCIVEFIKAFFEISDVPVRFRPHHFPFTEPSAEVDIGYSLKGNELILGGTDNWLEVLGCGMVHPKVLSNVGVDTNNYQGFAFGMGLERLAMLKYGIKDLRTFFEPDVRWLKHYGYAPSDIPSLIRGLTL